MPGVTGLDTLLKKLSIPAGSMKWAVWVGTAVAAGFLAILTSAGSLNPTDHTDSRLRALENGAAAQEQTNKRVLDELHYLRSKIDKIYENTVRE